MTRTTASDVQSALMEARTVGAPIDLVFAHSANQTRAYVLEIGDKQTTIEGARATVAVINAVRDATIELNKPRIVPQATVHRLHDDLLDIARAVDVVVSKDVHEFVGTGWYCTQCQLPRTNVRVHT